MPTYTFPYAAEEINKCLAANICVCCGANATNVVFTFNNNIELVNATITGENITGDIESKQFLSCDDCYDNLQKMVIPLYEFTHGIISKFTYYPQQVADNMKGLAVSPETVKIKLDSSQIEASLTCKYRTHNIIISNINDGISSNVNYFVPVYYTERKNRRTIGITKHYNLLSLYQENDSIMGYYQIDKSEYDFLHQTDLQMIDKYNINLFEMMLPYSKYAINILDASTAGTNYFSLLPIELLHIIIKLCYNKCIENEGVAIVSKKNDNLSII